MSTKTTRLQTATVFVQLNAGRMARLGAVLIALALTVWVSVGIGGASILIPQYVIEVVVLVICAAVASPLMLQFVVKPVLK